MALQLNDGYLDRPAIETVKAIQLYCYSLERCVYATGKSAGPTRPSRRVHDSNLFLNMWHRSLIY